MRPGSSRETGFTLLEVAIVLLIVSILLGYTVALFPKQQELKRYKQADRDMDIIIDTIIGFAQVNGRLPCPSNAASAGISAGGGATDCTIFGGFVPSSSLGIQGRLNSDNLLSDPWGNPYRYYVSASDSDGDGNTDFVFNGQMQAVGLGDVWDLAIPLAPVAGTDDYIDLDGQFLICDAAGTSTDDLCTGANLVFGNPVGAGGPYAGAPFVLISHGNSGDGATTNADELENLGATALGSYLVKNVAAGESTFVKRPSGFGDDFDDIVRWVSPNILYSRMIEASQLP
jgi:prepilin-type N-terminal cleavage/methylation domain-containing protein